MKLTFTNLVIISFQAEYKKKFEIGILLGQFFFAVHLFTLRHSNDLNVCALKGSISPHPDCVFFFHISHFAYKLAENFLEFSQSPRSLVSSRLLKSYYSCFSVLLLRLGLQTGYALRAARVSGSFEIHDLDRFEAYS